MELIECVGESSSPPRSFGGNINIGNSALYDIRNDVYNRLIEIGNEEAISNPDFRDILDAHFNRLPPSYVLDVNIDRVEDVLLHRRLLALAKDPEKRPVFHVRCMENFKTEGCEEVLAECISPVSRLLSDVNHGASLQNKEEGRAFEPCSKLEDLNLEVKRSSRLMENSGWITLFYSDLDEATG